MRAPAKYLFDHDFAAAGAGKPSSIALAEHAARLKDVEAAGYSRGFAAAQAEAKTDAERRSAAALERIAAALEGLDRGLAAVEARLETEAVEVAVAVARKLVPELVAKARRDRARTRARQPPGRAGRARHRARRLPHRMGRWRHQS